MTSTYIKSTNFGAKFNYKSECPGRYKIGAITTLLNRFYKICFSWDSINQFILNINHDAKNYHQLSENSE